MAKKKSKGENATQKAVNTATERRKGIPRYRPDGVGIQPVDVKFTEIAPSNQAVNATGGIQMINGASQGTSSSQRIGDSYVCKKLEWCFALKTTNATDVCRVMLIYDKQTNGADPSISDIIQGLTPYATPNFTSRERFIILYDEVYALNSGGDAAKVFRGMRDVDLQTQTFSSGSLSSSTWSGGIFLLYISDRTAANFPTLQGYFRTYFIDE